LTPVEIRPPSSASSSRRERGPAASKSVHKREPRAEPEAKTQSPAHRGQSPAHRVQSPALRVQSTTHRVQSSAHRVQSTAHRVQSSAHREQSPAHGKCGTAEVKGRGLLSPLGATLNKLLGWGERLLLGGLFAHPVRMGRPALPYGC